MSKQDNIGKRLAAKGNADKTACRGWGEKHAQSNGTGGNYINWEERERNQAAADKIRYLTMVFQFIAFTGRAVSKQEVLAKFPYLNVDLILEELGKMEPGVSFEMRTTEDGTEEAFYTTPPRPSYNDKAEQERRFLAVGERLAKSRKEEILAFIADRGQPVSKELIESQFLYPYSEANYPHLDAEGILTMLESEGLVRRETQTVEDVEQDFYSVFAEPLS